MKIHPTAIVCRAGSTGRRCRGGAHAIIGENVKLDAGCVVQAHAVLEGRATLGAGNFVGYGAIIGATPQDFAFRETVTSEVRIGDGNTFREYVTIHRGTKEGSATIVGNECYLMVGSHLGHNVKLGDKVVIANNCLLAGYVEIGDGAVLGGGTVFHQFLRVGPLAMVRGGTRFGKDIPPYVSADGENLLSGINAVGLRRAGFSPEVRMEIKRAFKLVYWSGINVSQALERAKELIWSSEAKVFFDFIGSSKRGVCGANRVPQGMRRRGSGKVFTATDVHGFPQIFLTSPATPTRPRARPSSSDLFGKIEDQDDEDEDELAKSVAPLARLPSLHSSRDSIRSRTGQGEGDDSCHPWKSVKIRGGKSVGLRAFRLRRGTDPGGDVDIPDADASAPGDFAAGFVFRHGLHEFVSKKSQLYAHRSIRRFSDLEFPP